MNPENNHEELDELLSGIHDLIDEDAVAEEVLDPDEYMEADEMLPREDFVLPEYLEQEIAEQLPEDAVEEAVAEETPEQTESEETFQNKRWTDNQRVPRHVAKLQNHQEEAYARWLKEQEEKGEEPPPVFEEEKPKKKHKKRFHESDGMPDPLEEREDDGKKKPKSLGWLWLCLAVLVVTAAVVVTAVWVLPRQPMASSELSRVSGISTIVVAGVDETLAQTDMVMLVTVDQPGERVNMISIPRDTQVADTFLGAVYGLAGGGQEGVQALKNAVEDCVGFMPDGCIVISPEAAMAFIDTMGGVEFNVPQNLLVGEVELQAGSRILTGEQAYALLRQRNEEQVLDLERTQLQQQFLSAMLYQCADLSTALDGGELLDIMTEKTVTDLSVRNFLWLAKAIYGADFGDVYTQTLPGDSEQIPGTYVLDEELVRQTVNAYCCPYIGGVDGEDMQTP